MADFTWSFSSLKEYTSCPKKYYEIRVAQNFEVIPSEQMIYGSEVHKALEEYVRDGKELAKNYLQYKEAADALIAIPGVKYCEYEMALTREKTRCDFKDPNRWVRGIVDLLIVDGDYAFIVDYKTGNPKYPDTKQLRLMALMTFVYFPEVNKIKAGLLFTKNNHFVTEEYRREYIDNYWDAFTVPLMRLTQSFETNTWPASPGPLCRYCSVTTCEFHKG